MVKTWQQQLYFVLYFRIVWGMMNMKLLLWTWWTLDPCFVPQISLLPLFVYPININVPKIKDLSHFSFSFFLTFLLSLHCFPPRALDLLVELQTWYAILSFSLIFLFSLCLTKGQQTNVSLMGHTRACAGSVYPIAFHLEPPGNWHAGY